MMGFWRAGIANREAGFRAGGEVQAPLAGWMVLFRPSRLRLQLGASPLPVLPFIPLRGGALACRDLWGGDRPWPAAWMAICCGRLMKGKGVV